MKSDDPHSSTHGRPYRRLWAATLGEALNRACGLAAAEEFSNGLELIVGELRDERGDDLAGEEWEEVVDDVGALVGDGDQYAAGIVWVWGSSENSLCFHPVEEG